MTKNIKKQRFSIASKTVAYANPWMTVFEYEILRDGKPGMYGVIKRADSVAIIPTTEDGRVLLLRVYRFPTESAGWEVPMGAIDPGEEATEAAIRELREETGLVATAHHLGSYRPMPGLSPQEVHVFSVVIPKKAIEAIEAFDEPVDEIVGRELVERAKLLDMVKKGELSDGFSLAALAVGGYLEKP